MTTTFARDRFVGCLVGLAAGDALGAPLEFMPRVEIAATFGEVRELLGGGWLNVEPGECTDDTQLAATVAESLVLRGQVDPTDLARRFVAWLRTGPKDVGQITRTAIRYHQQGVPWHEVGPRVRRELAGRSAGNGTLVRCVPVALLRADCVAALVRDSTLAAHLTHDDPLSVWSTVAVNLALAELLAGRADDLPLRVAERIDQPEVREVLLAAPALPRHAIRSGGHALETLGAAFWAFVNHPGFEDAVVAAVNLGDDADTIGAIVGALAGAREGIAAVPDRWLADLRDAEHLADLARALHRLMQAGWQGSPAPK